MNVLPLAFTRNLTRQVATGSCRPTAAATLSASRFKSTNASKVEDASSPQQSFTLPHIEIGPTHPSRYQDHYHNTLQEDLMYMTYDHNLASSPKSASTKASSPDGSHLPTPYEINRPAPAPRGNRPIRPSARPVAPTSIPKLESIILHTMVKESIGNKPALLSAIMALRQISGETNAGGGRKGSTGVQVLASRKGAAAFKLRAGMPVAVKVELKGQAMYDFIQCLVDFVFPRIREFPGIVLPPASSSSISPSATGGVIAFGLQPTDMALFPQIEVNLDSYPRLHGFHIQFLTNCKGKGGQDQARALLSGFRIPFARR
ncbi:hypothetical protein QFC19_004543 [Naganishia cerealis]|uniref:Uncharacterized protein n=1 Tax=Naganishia cerealis TaxID=610337 RepID=A0ACC2VWJ4_9TREE|nr:hypothetical protein QFC19_004543 [Naganishia cerealis]